MLKMLITNIIKNMLANDVKNEFEAEVVRYLKTNKVNIAIHLSMMFVVGFSLLMSLYELIIFSSAYLATEVLNYSHLISSGILSIISLLLAVKVFSYAKQTKLKIYKRVEEIKRQKLSPLTIFSPIIEELKRERIRYEISQQQQQQLQITQ